MAITPAMLAETLKRSKEFENLILELYGIHDEFHGYINWPKDAPNDRMTFTVTKLSDDGSKLAEYDYSIKIEIRGV